jgi:general secretion pathway protein F
MAPIYDYKAVGADGKGQRGIVESETLKSARQKLKKQGLMVTEIVEKTSAHPNSSGGIPFLAGRVSVKDIAMITRQLASLIKANVPLVEGLNALVEQVERDNLKVILSQVRQDVNEGLSLAKAMGKHPKAFDSIFINMVEAGESSGTLGVVLLKLADLKEAQLTQVFESMNKPVPLITQVLMYISDFIVSWWPLIAVAVFTSISMFIRWTVSPMGRPKWDRFKLKIPVFGPLVRMIAVTRFASTMSTLLGSGVPILNAMSISKNLVGNVPIAEAVAKARENITEGQSIAEPLRRSGEFPPMVIHMIAIGEKTGELPEMLRNISENYEEQINTQIDGMTALLEPMMIIGMGGVVGVIVMAIFVPLLEISNIN